MLKALYDYGVRHELVLPAGYVKKTIKAYISLSAEGDFRGIHMGSGETVLCPDIGSYANAKDKCNAFAEKRFVILNEKPKTDDPLPVLKNAFFRRTLREASEFVPELTACIRVLEDEQTLQKIRDELDKAKVKRDDRISFRVDGKSVLEFPGLKPWWESFRKQFLPSDTAPTARCLITGKPTVPLTTTAPIQGLQVVGGHGRGDALICFDKAAFCSYNLEQAANAPVSEEAYAAVKAALDDLLRDAPVLAGMKFVHWYDRDIPTEADPLWSEELGFAVPDENEDETNDEEPPAVNDTAERRKADKVPESIHSGQEALKLDGTRYFIILLSGVSGRIMIRRYERGSYEELRRNLSLWYDDLRLTNPSGSGLQKPCKLTARILKLLKYQKTDKNPFDRMSKELSGVTPVVLQAILNGGPLPDSVAAKALERIRSELLENSENEAGQPLPNGRACQWLKVWLLRKNRAAHQEVPILEGYNMNLNNTAYHCGGLMAVYAAIQKAAMPDVNTGIVERYYASAIQMPGLVIGQLSSRSNYHLEKLENQWLAEQYRSRLGEVSAALGSNIPATLNLEQQSYFALGYYQMSAKLNQEKAERIAAAKAKTARENG